MPKTPWASSPLTTADYGTTVPVPGEPVTTILLPLPLARSFPQVEPHSSGGLRKPSGSWVKSGKEALNKILSA